MKIKCFDSDVLMCNFHMHKNTENGPINPSESLWCFDLFGAPSVLANCAESFHCVEIATKKRPGEEGVVLPFLIQPMKRTADRGAGLWVDSKHGLNTGICHPKLWL